MIFIIVGGSGKPKKLKKTSDNHFTLSKISTSSIEKIIEDSTKKNYYTIWKMFNNFFIRLDRKPREWYQCLTLFVAYLIDNKKQSSTVKSYISAIKAVLQDNGIKLQKNQCLLTSLTRACHLTNDKVRQ